MKQASKFTLNNITKIKLRSGLFHFLSSLLWPNGFALIFLDSRFLPLRGNEKKCYTVKQKWTKWNNAVLGKAKNGKWKFVDYEILKIYKTKKLTTSDIWKGKEIETFAVKILLRKSETEISLWIINK